MKKTILIPTDFTVQSLHLIKEALNAQGKESVNILLVYGLKLSDSITDLLFFSRSKIIQDLENESFRSSFEFLKSKYENQLNSARIDIFTGGVQSVFDAYLNTAGVDEIYYCDNQELNMIHRNSMSLIPYIEKCDVEKTAIKWNSKWSEKRESEPMAELFFTQ